MQHLQKQINSYELLNVQIYIWRNDLYKCCAYLVSRLTKWISVKFLLKIRRYIVVCSISPTKRAKFHSSLIVNVRIHIREKSTRSLRGP
jgi:hypothetical protein